MDQSPPHAPGSASGTPTAAAALVRGIFRPRSRVWRAKVPSRGVSRRHSRDMRTGPAGGVEVLPESPSTGDPAYSPPTRGSAGRLQPARPGGRGRRPRRSAPPTDGFHGPRAGLRFRFLHRDRGVPRRRFAAGRTAAVADRHQWPRIPDRKRAERGPCCRGAGRDRAGW